MKTIVIASVIIAVILIAGTFGVMALNKQANIIPCSSCDNKCTGDSNCGNPNCGALNGGTCNCNSSSGCGSCNGSCGGTCGSSECSATTSATKTCGCSK